MPTSPDDQTVAIVGMSCRFAPDLTSPAKLWDFLLEGLNATVEVPDERWGSKEDVGAEAAEVLSRTTRRGAYLKDIDGFDAEFFQITPREAEYIDPQQRILLELAWEALADAGIAPLSLSAGDTGVYVAANSNDYGRRLFEDVARSGAWAVNGATYFGIANRISHCLDLRGPSMLVDTACAGSLTALHLAAQALRLGETPVAIAGGVHIMASPGPVVALDAAHATSPDGRSKSFDADADGYGRGDGAALMVLKLLSDARRDGDPVRAIIRGSGVFQDGRSVPSMMAPSAEAQAHMLREVYRRAEIEVSSVDYLEAHGTGTPKGDLAETTAIGEVLGAARNDGDPLLIGSLKANIGHVEAASGIAGAIKVILAMERETIPPTPHEKVNPELGLESNRLKVVAAPTPWPASGRTRRAGISSYGVGGTIAHLILDEPPRVTAQPTPTETTGIPQLLPLSAASVSGLRGLAEMTAAWLREHPTTPLVDIAHTLTRRRSHLGLRCAIVASSTAEFTELLDTFAAGERSPLVTVGRDKVVEADDAVWVFSGHGSQWTGMGRELLECDTAFAETIDSLAEVYQAELGWTPREAIGEGGPWTVTIVQAMTFAMHIALAASWRARGIRPRAVIGHSAGEIAAAVTAGSLELIDAARFCCRRAAALEQIAGRGAMATVALPFDETVQRLASRTGVAAAIAASPSSTVISGDVDAVEEAMRELSAQGTEVRRVNTDVAFHSSHVEQVLPAIATAAAQLSAVAPHTTLYSTALDDPRATDLRSGSYWETNLRSPVRFVHAVTAAMDDGARTFLEVSAAPLITRPIAETAYDADLDDAVVVATLRRDRPEVATMLGQLARLFVTGSPVDWRQDGELVGLPSVSWQHRPYWIFDDSSAPESGRGTDANSEPADELSGSNERSSERMLIEVREHVADELSMPFADVDVETPLVELGVDSVFGLALRVRLKRRFGVELPSDILWGSSPSVRSIAEFLSSDSSTERVMSE